MNRWVYRRPFLQRIVRPKIPLGRAALTYVFRRRAIRRRLLRGRLRHRALVFSVTATAGTVFVRRVRLPASRIRRASRRVAIPHGVAQQQASLALVRRLIKTRRAQNRAPARRPFVGPVSTPTFGMPIIVQKAIARIRRAFQIRLRFKPRKFELPTGIPETVISYPRGEIQAAGAVVGEIYSAGSKRGWVE